MLMRTIIGICAVLAASVVMAQAYRWVDENGVVLASNEVTIIAVISHFAIL